nr:hypothetical protein [Thermoplasma volcanium]
MEKLVNWEAFRPMLADLYRNNTELGGDQTTIPYSWSRYSSCSLYTIWLMRPWRRRSITA